MLGKNALLAWLTWLQGLSTPQRSDKSNTPTGSDLPQTPINPSSSASNQVLTLKLSNTAYNIRNTLAQNGMFISCDVLKTKYMSFQKEVEALLNGARASAMKAESVKHVDEWLEKNDTRPEDDIMWQLLPMIVPEKSSASEAEAGVYSVRWFSEDGSIVSRNQQFQNDLLPFRQTDAEKKALTKSLMKDLFPGMTNAKPDFTYGVREKQHPDIQSEHYTPHTRALMGVAPYLMHPFLIVEGKSCNGSHIDAENQAIRGGATLVNARRMLNAKAKMSDALGPDKNSFIFTVTMDTNFARIWINWCEIQLMKGADGKEKLYETFHMNALDSFQLRGNRNNLADMRKVMHNVIDWGLWARMEEIRVVMNKVFETEQAALLESKGASKKASSPKKRKLDVYDMMGEGWMVEDWS